MSERVMPVQRERAIWAAREMLEALGHDPTSGALEGTPRRVVDALLEMTSGYEESASEHLSVGFDETSDGIVLVRNVPFVSLCEHHILPFEGRAWVAYIPDGSRVVGLSKLARTVDVFARRLQLQERIGAQVADAIVEHCGARGVAVVLEAEHGCMTCRGAKKAGASMRTSTMRGVFREDPAARAEVLMLFGLTP